MLCKGVSCLERRLAFDGEAGWVFRGSAGRGIGSPHVGPGYIWPMSIIMQVMPAGCGALRVPRLAGGIH